jgi:hypothetical protein
MLKSLREIRYYRGKENSHKRKVLLDSENRNVSKGKAAISQKKSNRICDKKKINTLQQLTKW